MAWDTPKSGKTTVFPGKFKTFVRDVASLKRTSSGHSRAKSVASVATESERAWSIASDFDCPEEQPEHRAGISVQLSLSFEDPLEFSCNRCYNSSADFKPSERLLRGLLRRIDHGSFELITRKDPVATAATKGEGRPKPLRFEMTFQISQKGSPWATRTYKSYQKDAMSANSVKEVVLSSHRLIGLFLRRHDPDFVWRDGPIRDELPEGPETSTYRVGGIQPMSCIPRSRFLEKTQTFEAIPGFKIELSITSKNQRRKPPEWQRNIEVDSHQTTPLNLAVAEALFSNASYVLEAALRQRRKLVEERHRQSCGFVSANCPHYEEDATNISLRVTNNLGPQFDHLQRTITSKLALIGDVEGKDVSDLISNLEGALGDARDTADHSISRTNDFEFRIVELRGRGWNIDEPLVFTLGPADSYSRRSVQAILDRVQAGVADVLRGNAATVRMSAAKRGHYILDKTLLAPRDPTVDAGRWSIPSKNKAKVVDKLRRRVHQDIDMICKDTCSLDNLDDNEPANISDLPSKVDVFGQTEFEALNVPLPGTPSPMPYLANYESTLASKTHDTPQTPSEGDKNGSIFTPQTSERPRPRSFAYLKTGARAFPLVPIASSYGFTETLAPANPPKAADPIDVSASTQSTTGTRDMPEISQSAGTSAVPPLEGIVAPADQQSALRPESASAGEERRLSTSTVDQQRHSDAEEISIAPSTPSLVFGGGHSAASSLYLFTPQIQGSGSGLVDDFLSPGASDSQHEAHAAVENAESNSQIKPSPLTADLSSPRFGSLTKHKPMPSPLQHQNRVSDESVSDATNRSRRDSAYSTSEAGDLNGRHASGTGAAKSTSDSNHENSTAVVEPTRDADNADIKPQMAKTDNLTAAPESEVLHEESDSDASLPELPRSKSVVNEVTGTGPNPGTVAESPDIHKGSEQLANDVVGSPVVGSPTPAGVRTPMEPLIYEITTPSDGFAQTRQEFDFDFSSPWSAASPYSEVAQGAYYANLDNAIDDGTEDESGNHDNSATNKLLIPRPHSASSSSLVRPSSLFSRTRRHRSFGSAGLLGFRVGEPRLIEVGFLRRTMMMIPMMRGGAGATGVGGAGIGSPTTAMSFLNNLGRRHHHRGRPVTADGADGRELVRSRRPASSHGGDEAGVMRNAPEMEQTLMRRSASSGLLQDMVLVEAKERRRPREKGKDGVEKNKKKEDKDDDSPRGRSGSLMFLIAGATLASHLMGTTATK